MKEAPLSGMATDDSHNYFGNRGSSPGRGWVMVKASKLDADAIIRSMEKGDFYSSSGVTLSKIKFDEKARVLTVEMQPEEGIEYVTEFIGTPVDYDKSSEPVTDKDGKPIHATRRYSADVGAVLSKVEGAKATYKLTGDELYVRAVVTSSKKHWNPSFDGQREQAWTQTVGWRQHVGKD
jgi:hypothetical protein